MLQSSGVDGSVKGGSIYDSRGRVEASGPFPTPLEFYETRAPLFMDCGKDGAEPGPDGCIPPCEILSACGPLIDPNHLTGPIYLSHPDWAIINLMFDDDFNITAVLHWNSSQILPLESFAQPGQESCSTTVVLQWFVNAGFMIEEKHREMSERRRRFLEILEAKELTEYGKAKITEILTSSRSHFVREVDQPAILGLGTYMILNRKNLSGFVIRLERSFRALNSDYVFEDYF